MIRHAHLVLLLALLPLIGCAGLANSITNLGADLEGRFEKIELAQAAFSTGQITRQQLDATLASERIGIQGDVRNTIQDVRDQIAAAKAQIAGAVSTGGSLIATAASNPAEAVLAFGGILASLFATKKAAEKGASKRINAERDLNRRLRGDSLEVPASPPRVG